MVARTHKYANGGKIVRRVQNAIDKALGYPQGPTPPPSKKPAPKAVPAGTKEKFE